MYPLGEASGGQEQYYVRSAWYLQLDVRLAWHVQTYPGQMYPLCYRHLVAKSGITSGQLNMSAWHLQSDIPMSKVTPHATGIWWPRAILCQVSLTWHFDICSQTYPGQMYTQLEASGGQEQYYIRSAWHLQSDVKSTWHLQSDIPRSDVPPGRGI